MIVHFVGGSGEPFEEEISPATFSAEIPGLDGQYKPALVERVEIETSPENTKRQDQCGNTSRSKTTNEGWTLRVEGLVTPNTSRLNNLALPILRDELAEGDSITVYSAIFSGNIVVSNCVITDSNDIPHQIHTNEMSDFERAYGFTLTLGEEESSQ